MASETSFRRAGKRLSLFLAEDSKHSLLHRRAKRRGSERAVERRRRRRAEELFSLGALPPSQGEKASKLFVEADGCMISLQREQRIKHGL